MSRCLHVRCRRWLCLLGHILLLFAVSSCRGNPQPTSSPVFDSPVTFDSPVVTSLPSLAAAEEAGRRLTVLESFAIAQKRAQEWDPAAQWTAILPTTIMASNLGYVMGAEGWFFKFELPDSPVEYYIHVSDGRVTGSTEAQPLIDPPYEFVPLEVSELEVDSKDVWTTFLETKEGQAYARSRQDVAWDYRLVHLKGTPHPVWSLFDTTRIDVSLVNVDAITGEIVEDPFGT